jgi:hypothetical protein
VTVSSRLLDLVARMLEPNERDAVRGDLAESGESGARQLREITGLAVRRHAALWFNWRPWLALLGLAVPLSLVLSFFIRGVTEGSALYLWMYSAWWTPSFLTIPGARVELASNVGLHLLSFVTLMAWAWTCGFVLSSLSRRTLWVNGSIFCLVLFAEFLVIPQNHHGNSAVFSLAFFRVVFPILLRTLLVVVPALWGMQAGFRRATLPLWHALLWAGAIAALTIRAADGLQGSVMNEIINTIVVGPYTVEQGRTTLEWQTWLEHTWPLPLLPLIVAWPAAYVVATSGWRTFHNRVRSAKRRTPHMDRRVVMTRRDCTGITLAAALVAVSLGSQPRVSAEVAVPAARPPAPNFTLKKASGKPARLSDYTGKVLLLDFWAT